MSYNKRSHVLHLQLADDSNDGRNISKPGPTTYLGAFQVPRILNLVTSRTCPLILADSIVGKCIPYY